MKTRYLIACSLLAFGLYAPHAGAEVTVGVKGGLVDYDARQSDPGLNGSVQVGVDILDLQAADIAVEGEVSTSFVEGEINNREVDFQTMGVYSSIRTAGPVYFIGRVGVVNAEIENTDDTDIAMGLGVGFSTGIRWEVEYNTYEVEGLDVEYLTLGFSF